jgi:CheY-like chemotaxis protein
MRGCGFDHEDAGYSMTSLNAPSVPEPGPLSGLSVLVVEDSWQVGAAVKRLLQACGADVAGPAATVADAARLISERTIDLALVDINLRGGELAYGLIDQLHDQGIRTVVVTGYADVSLKEGKVAAVLQKPVSAPLLVRACAQQS